MGEGVSVKWTCDYPECLMASKDHEGWMRLEEFPHRSNWLAFAIPFGGNMLALLAMFLQPEFHYCPEHIKFLGLKEKP